MKLNEDRKVGATEKQVFDEAFKWAKKEHLRSRNHRLIVAWVRSLICQINDGNQKSLDFWF